MKHEQTPGPNPAQNETKKTFNDRMLDVLESKGFETTVRIGAISSLGFSALFLAGVAQENQQIESFRNGAVIQEQQGIPHGAEYANQYASQLEQKRNQHLTVAALAATTGFGGIAAAGALRRERRTREVVISGEKPTEPSDK